MAAPMRYCLGHCIRSKSVISKWYNVSFRPCNVLYGARQLTTTELLSNKETGSLAEEFKRATEGKEGPSPRKSIGRTSENSPLNHTTHHDGLFYSIPPADFDRWLSMGLHPQYYQQVKAFNENCLMVRQPALEIFNCLRASDFTLPVVRYLLYGTHGAGKSISLAHVMHFCGRQGWLMVHVPWAPVYGKWVKELQVSSHNPERVDCPVEAAEWLNYFREANEELIIRLDLRAQNKYTWSKREACEVGTPWIDLIEYGLTRAKYSCDVMGAILKEAREQSTQGKLKTLVAIDGMNALWHQTAHKRKDDGRYKYQAQDMTIYHNLRKMVANNWSGGAVIGTVDAQGAPEDRAGSYLPRSILDKEALDTLDPHIPIQVPNYSEKEIHSCIEYYIDRKWIQRPEGLTEDGKKEMIFLSCKNPQEMFNITARW